MNYVQFHIGDWISDTDTLTASERGIYIDLVMRYYKNEGPLSDDLCKRIARAYANAEQEDMQYVLQNFFTHDAGAWHHKRCDEEIAKVLSVSTKRKRAAEARWNKKEANAKQMECTCNANADANAMLTNNQEPITNNQYINKVSNDTLSAEQETPVVLEPKNPVQRLASHCPHEKLISLYQQEMPQNPVVRSWNSPARKNSMQSRWRAIVTDKKFETEAEGLEWFRRFFEYCNRSSFLRGDATPTADGRTFIADLEWLMKPSNFDKVIDGKYHH